MPVRLSHVVLLLIALGLLAGCGGGEPTTAAVEPAAPTIAPTDTAVPPTEAPTNTPFPATEAPISTPPPPAEVPSDAGPPPTEAPSDTPLPPTEAPVGTPSAVPEPTATLPPPNVPEPTAGATGFLLEGMGFDTPESVLYDAQEDVYLVSNINGNPGDKDGNGFISRVSPEGRLLDLKWIDGAAEGVTLNAPKGLALFGDALYVTDIDTVRVFERSTGAPLSAVAVEGASFLNDAAAAEDGSVYVTDSGSGYIYVISPEGSATRLDDVQFKGLNGIVGTGAHIWVTVGGPLVWELDENGVQVGEVQVPAGALDGLVQLADASLLVSSWQAGAVYWIDVTGQASEVAVGINGPADIGFDSKRNLVLIPHFQDDRVQAIPLP